MNHETFVRVESVEIVSDRTFGFVLSAAFFLIAMFPIVFGGTIRIWSVVVGSIFFTLAIFRPSLLSELNKYWMKFGLLLHRLISPVVLAVLFFLILTPYSFVLKAFRKDVLPLSLEPASESYWIVLSHGESAKGKMTNQF